MAKVEIIVTTASEPNLGSLGQVKEVKQGYFFNYLQPRGFAIRNNKNNQNRMKSIAEKETKRLDVLKTEAEAIVKTLDGKTLVFTMDQNEEGTLFGSISKSKISEHLNKDFEVKIDSKLIKLANPIKEVGKQSVTLELHPGVSCSITVDVQANNKEDKKSDKK